MSGGPSKATLPVEMALEQFGSGARQMVSRSRSSAVARRLP